MANQKKHNLILEDGIDLVALAITIWGSRGFILKITGVSIVLGLVIAFTTPPEYEASTKLLPESTEGTFPNLGRLSGLVGLAGIDLNSSTDNGTLSPQLYPEIVNSLPFLLDVMNDTLYFERVGLHTTPMDYFENMAKPTPLGYVSKYTIGLPRIIKKSIFSETTVSDNFEGQFYRFSKDQWNLIESFKERIHLRISDDTGLISISVEMPDAYAAAQITEKIENKVRLAVISYKTEKAKKNLEFVEKAYEESKLDFEESQVRLARAADRNKNVISASGQIEQRRLENDYDVAFEVYKGLALQLEQSKIQLKERTPVFTVLEPVRIPEDKVRPRRAVILMVFSILGVLLGISLVVGKNVLKKK